MVISGDKIMGAGGRWSVSRCILLTFCTFLNIVYKFCIVYSINVVITDLKKQKQFILYWFRYTMFLSIKNFSKSIINSEKKGKDFHLDDITAKEIGGKYNSY